METTTKAMPPDAIPESIRGVGGDLESRGVKRDLALVRKATRLQWEIPDAIRQHVVLTMGRIIKDSAEERNKIAAAKVLVAADSVNARREANEMGVGQVNTQVNVQINNQIGQALLNDATRALLADLTASLIPSDAGTRGQPGEVDTSASPEPTQSGAVVGSSGENQPAVDYDAPASR